MNGLSNSPSGSWSCNYRSRTVAKHYIMSSNASTVNASSSAFSCLINSLCKAPCDQIVFLHCKEEEEEEGSSARFRHFFSLSDFCGSDSDTHYLRELVVKNGQKLVYLLSQGLDSQQHAPVLQDPT